MILIKNRFYGVSNKLTAGFFSNFNAVINWYWYSMRTEIPVYVYWDGLPDKNIFDVFFTQKFKYTSHDYENNANLQHSPLFTDQIKDAFREDVGNTLFDKYNGWFFCQGMVYTDSDFYKLRQLYNYVYTENLKLNNEFLNPKPLPQKTLGVNYRYIHAYATNDTNEIPFNRLLTNKEYHEKYLNQIESIFENGKYDKIYLSSSQKPFLDICLKVFKDKLLYLPMKRVEENQTEFDRGVGVIEEYTNVWKDVLSLIKCDYLLISPSNIIFAALYINPDINFEVIDFLKQTHTG